MDDSLGYVLENALLDYSIAEDLYSRGRHADVCLKSYDIALHLLKAYAITRGHELPRANIAMISLLELAVNLGVSDPEVLQELSRLSFMYVYFNYPELRVYSDVEFQEITARMCLKAVKVISEKLLGQKLPDLA
ncbi:MAG: HEPN domain-containing protein [Acidilobaceae archaeon]